MKKEINHQEEPKQRYLNNKEQNNLTINTSIPDGSCPEEVILLSQRNPNAKAEKYQNSVYTRKSNVTIAYKRKKIQRKAVESEGLWSTTRLLS